MTEVDLSRENDIQNNLLSKFKYLALTFSVEMTRESLRNFQSNWLVPTSTANTLAAPCWRRQSVKPPVEAPISRQTRPATFNPKKETKPSGS